MGYCLTLAIHPHGGGRDNDMMIFGILGILLIVYLLFNTDTFDKKKDSARKEHDEALDALIKRYAEGSLSREEYLRMKEDISN